MASTGFGNIVEGYSHRGPKKQQRGVKESIRNITAARNYEPNEFGGIVTTDGVAAPMSIAVPDSSLIQGVEMAFFINENFCIVIRPASGDKFLGKTVDKARYCEAAGGCIVLVGSTDGLLIKSEVGTWADES